MFAVKSNDKKLVKANEETGKYVILAQYRNKETNEQLSSGFFCEKGSSDDTVYNNDIQNAQIYDSVQSALDDIPSDNPDENTSITYKIIKVKTFIKEEELVKTVVK